MDAKQIFELQMLIVEMLEGDINREDQQRLAHLLSSDPKALEYYLDAIDLNTALQNVGGLSTLIDVCLGDSDQCDHELLDEMLTLDERGKVPPFVMPSRSEDRINEIEAYANRKLQDFLEQEHLQEQQSVTYQPRRGLLDVVREQIDLCCRFIVTATHVVKTGLVVGAILLVLGIVGLSLRAGRVVATLEDSMHARWEKPPQGEQLRPGWLKLEQGFARVKLKQGTDLVLQAPCRFKLQSANRLFLGSGSVAARVPKEALGFTIATPGSNIVDFGTEFGVLARADGSSETYVFNGQVGVQSQRGIPASKAPETLIEGQAIAVDASGNLNTIPHNSSLIARFLPESAQFGIPGKCFSLADVVGSGNGFGTGQSHCTIDPFTGRFVWEYDDAARIQGDPNALPLHLRAWVPAYVEDAQGNMVISGAGQMGISYSGSDDDLRFVCQKLSGDGSLVARIDSLQYIHSNTSAAVMIRETLATGSKHASMVVNFQDRVMLQYRLESYDRGWGPFDATHRQQGISVPVWLKIERFGNQFSGYYALDESRTEWIPLACNPLTIRMRTDVYIGLAVSSSQEGYPTLAEISHVSTTGRVAGERTCVVVGDEADHPTNGYIPVLRHEYVDGVFCPPANAMPVTVSSAGHTSILTSVPSPMILTANGGISSVFATHSPLEQNGDIVLDGQVYGSAMHPVILMQHNNGITFDLNAIRANMKEARIKRFTALCGLAEEDHGAQPKARANFYVLVDGDIRFAGTDVSIPAQATPIDLELIDADRFLTFIVTFVENRPENPARAVFAEPALRFTNVQEGITVSSTGRSSYP